MKLWQQLALLAGVILLVVIFPKTHFHSSESGSGGSPTEKSQMSMSEIRGKLVGKTFPCTNRLLATLTADEAERLGELLKEGDKAAITRLALAGQRSKEGQVR
jgi:hypothetical protein